MTNIMQIDDISRGLYEFHLSKKNFRVCEALKVLFLRKDFSDLLNKLRDKGIVKNKHNGKEFWAIDFQNAPTIINSYLKPVFNTAYFNNHTEKEISNLKTICYQTLLYTYTDGLANEKNKQNILTQSIYIDHKNNYPNITNTIFEEKYFWDKFEKSFSVNGNMAYSYSGKISIGGSTYSDLPEKLKLEIAPDEPKICQIVFDETTEITELIDYIKKNFGEINDSLKSMRPVRSNSRMTSSRTFMRDIDILNKHEEYKKNKEKNPDVKTYAWLLSESDYKIELEPNTIRKNVSNLKKEIKNLNSNN